MYLSRIHSSRLEYIYQISLDFGDLLRVSANYGAQMALGAPLELDTSVLQVNACESITRLVSEIKQLLLLGDFRWLEAAVREEVEERDRRRADLDAVAARLHEEVSRDLCTLEEILGPTRPSSLEKTS